MLAAEPLHLGQPMRAREMAKSEQTGTKAGKAASKVLKDGRTGKDSKTAAGSALTQRPDKGGGKGKKK